MADMCFEPGDRVLYEFLTTAKKLLSDQEQKGSLQELNMDSSDLLDIRNLNTGVADKCTLTEWSKTSKLYKAQQPYISATFTANEIVYLKHLYDYLVGSSDVRISCVPEIHGECSSLHIGRDRIGSKSSRLSRYSFILASWYGMHVP